MAESAKGESWVGATGVAMVPPGPHPRHDTGENRGTDWGSPGTFRFLWAITIFELFVVTVGAVAAAEWWCVALVVVATLGVAGAVLAFMKSRE